MLMRSFKPLIPIVLVLVGLGVGFFGGFEYRNYQLRKNIGNLGRSRNANGMAGRNTAVGKVLSIDDKGITVKLADESSKIVLFTDSTTYSNNVSASKSDLKTGINVVVFGSPNSDGSVTA